jgi:hypothetical protein
MASVFGKISKFARTPQGQRMISEASRRAQQVAKDPATRAKVQQLSSRLNKQRGTR